MRLRVLPVRQTEPRRAPASRSGSSVEPPAGDAPKPVSVVRGLARSAPLPSLTTQPPSRPEELAVIAVSWLLRPPLYPSRRHLLEPTSHRVDLPDVLHIPHR